MITCHDRAALDRFLLGRLPDVEADQIQRHLAECPSCLGMVQSSRPEDTLVQALRNQTRGAPRAEDDRVTELILKLSGFPSEPAAAAPALAPARAADELGRLGPYRVLKKLGAGGMGVVFEAEDPSLNRRVAIKVMKPALAADEGQRRRFLREARAAAALDHDHVVAVHQVGEEGGVPFLVMPLLKGESLEDRLQRDRVLPVGEVARVGREIALGLAAAHERGLIHRDVKPANIWLEAPADRVKLLDFGLARPVSDDTPLTREGIVGTPHYMAPEQAEGRAVDARGDLFALGCVLYRMATGRLYSLAERPTPPRRHRPELPRAVNDLIVRLLAPAPADRPSSARIVADALARLGRPSPRRWGRVIVAAGLAAAVLIGAVVWLVPQWQTPPPIPTAESADLIGLSQVLRGHKEPVHAVAFFPGGQRILSGSRDGALMVWNLDGGVAERSYAGPADGVGSVAISTDGRQVLVGCRDGTVQLREGDTVREVFRSSHKELIIAAFAPGDATAVFSCYMGQVVYWDLAKGEPIRVLNHAAKRSSAAISADGRYLASAGFIGWVSVYDLNDGREVRLLQTHPSGTRDVRFTPDGQYLLTAGFEGDLRLWNAWTGKEVRRFRGHVGTVLSAAISADGTRAVTGGEDRTVRLWNLETGEELRVFPGHASYVMGVAFSPDGHLAVSASDDRTVRVWRLPP